MPAKADPAAQAAFLKTTLQPRLRQARRGERAVLFVDAAHFVHGAFLGCVWALVRLFQPTPSGRSRYSVLGAVDAVTGRLLHLATAGSINAERFCELLDAVRAAYAGRVTLVLDNARYQRCAEVTEHARRLRIELLYLPPYSPNLNLIERLWKFVKKKCLYSRYYATFSEFRAAIDHCLDGCNGAFRNELESLLTLNFQTFDDVPILAA